MIGGFTVKEDLFENALDYTKVPEQKKVELDLNNPIFVYYINIAGLTRQRSEEAIYQIIHQFSYSNVTMWFVPTTTSPTKIECVYDGQLKNRGSELKKLIEEINTKINILSDSRTFDDFKVNIRDWRIDELLIDDTEQKK